MDEQTCSLDGRFDLLQKLGEGGMGTVYLARQNGIDRLVAIKVLKESVAHSLEQQRRFRNEAKLTSALNHPNIVSVYATGISEQGSPYIAMELLDGHALSDLIKESGFLSYKQVVPLFIQACDALDHAHQKGIYHRDVKPSNLVVINQTRDPDGTLSSGAERKPQHPLVKLVDFGIAKAFTDEAITRTNMPVGSAFYLSPGQSFGRFADPRSDIYSLGCTLFECLAGRPPFVGQNTLDTMQKHLEETPPLVHTINPHTDAPEALGAVVACCLSKEPDLRYASTLDLKHDLLLALSGRWPEKIPTDGRAAKRSPLSITSRIRNRPLKLLALVAAVSGLAATAIIATVHSPSLNLTGPPEEQDRAGKRTRVWTLIQRGRKQTILHDYKQAQNLTLDACRQAEALQDPELECRAAVEYSLSCLGDPNAARNRLYKLPVPYLERACRDWESAITKKKVERKQAAGGIGLCAHQLYYCYTLTNQPEKALKAARKAVDCFRTNNLSDDPSRSLEATKSCSEILPYCIRENLVEDATYFAEQRIRHQRQRGTSSAEIKKELDTTIKKAQLESRPQIAERLAKLSPLADRHITPEKPD